MNLDNLTCPKCRQTDFSPHSCQLERRQVQRTTVIVDRCPNCRGLWFDGEELRRALKDAGRQLNNLTDAQPSSLHCPLGHGQLWRLHHRESVTIIDVCLHCFGTWLDSGEFRRIRSAPFHEITLPPETDRLSVRESIAAWIDRQIELLDQFD